MVDTALRPRPKFGTFLHSDANAGGDGLSFYEYKKLLRSKKVALLQERRANLYEPGYKKPRPGESVHVYSKEENAVPEKAEAQTQTTISASGIGDESLRGRVVSEHQVKVTRTERAPVKETGQVLSARAHSRHATWPNGEDRLCATTRPATVGPGSSRRDSADPQMAALRQSSVSEQAVPTQKLWVERRQRTLTDPSTEKGFDRPPSRLSVRDAPSSPPEAGSKPNPADVQALVNSYCWTSATHKSYSDVKWENKLPANLPSPDPSTLCNRPDSVSLRFVMKRMEIHPQNWQNLGPVWDFVQTRQGCYHRPGNRNLFCSPSRNTQHIPGYLGHIPGVGRVERAEGDCKASTQILVTQPRPTCISRRANIPGYSGCIHWSNSRPAHSVMRPPYSTTQLRTHRDVLAEEDATPFQRTGVMSKMVSLNAPYNPFNKVEA